MADKNVVRQDVVQIVYESDFSGLTKANKETDKLKRSITGGLNNSINSIGKEFDKLKSSVSKLGSNKGISKLKSGCEKVKDTLAKGATKAKTFVKSLKLVDKVNLNTVNTKINSLIKKIGTGLVTAAKRAALGLAALATAGAVGVFKLANMASDLSETINKVDVSFGSSSGEVKEWAKGSIKNMGLAQQTALDMTALFGDMGTSMGIPQKEAAKMSMEMTQLGADLASFKNMDIEEVTTALNGVFTGETESLKRLGIVMTQTNLEQWALRKGYKKSIKEMSQAELVQLRYAYVMEKTTNAQGDFVRTGGGFANQLRMFNEQFKEIGTNIGKVFEPAMTKGLNVLNEFGTEINEILADGFQEGDLDKILNKFGAIGKAIKDVVDKIKDISKNSKKMNKLRKILDKIKTLVDTIVRIAGKLVQKFLDFATAESTLDVIDGLLEDINDALEWCEDNVEAVETAFAGVIGVIAGLKLSKFITDIQDALVKAKLLKTELTGMQKLTLAIGVTLAITGIVMEGKGIADTMTEGLNSNNFGEILGGGATLVAGGTMIGKTLGSAIIGGAIAAIPAGIGMFFAGIWDAIKNGIDWLSALLIGGGGALAGAGIGSLIGSVGGPLGALVGLVIGLVTDLVIFFWQNFNSIEQWFGNLPNWVKVIGVVIGAILMLGNPLFMIIGAILGVITVIKKWDVIVEWVRNLGSKIGEFFSNLWMSICSLFSKVGAWVNANIIQPVKNFLLNLFYFVVGLAVTIWEGIKAVILPIATWVYNNIIQPVVNFFVWLWSKVVLIATLIWAGIRSVWGFISTWVNTNVIQPVVSFFTALRIKIVEIVNKVWNTICLVWGVISGWVSENIIEPVKSFFTSLWDDITNAVDSVKTAITDAFQTAFDNVKEIWNGITSFFSNLWDSIKGTVNKIIGKGKEALGVSNSVENNGETQKHAWGGLMTTPHFGLVAEAGPEMIIPLSKNKRSHALSLWEQAGRMMGVGTIPYMSSYTPEHSTTSYSRSSSYENNTYAPVFNLTMSGSGDERAMARKVKRWVAEGVEDMFTSMSNKNRPVREV